MSREMARRLARIAFCCAAVFAYLSAIIPAAPNPLGNDKLNHILAFTTLALLARFGWSRSSAYLIGLGLIAFGGAIEISQALKIVHRDPSWIDLLVDTIAVVLGLVAGIMLLNQVRRRSLRRQEPL